MLTNQTAQSAQKLLDELLDAQLLERIGYGRYGLHRLVRAYAAERLSIDEPVSRSRQALERLLDQRELLMVG